MIVAREPEQARTTYLLRDQDGNHIDSLTFREVMAMVAAESGRVRARWHRTRSPWFDDAHLVPECDDYGIGYGTLAGLQSRWGRDALLDSCGTDEGPLGLTAWGREVLALIRSTAALTPGEQE